MAYKARAGVGPFSMTDEERDIGQFAAYVAALAPESLWDVLSHLDAERYPRRRETVLREMARRRLFFVVPYTRWELRLRAFVGGGVFLAALAALLRLVGSFRLDLSPHEKLPFFTDLAVGSRGRRACCSPWCAARPRGRGGDGARRLTRAVSARPPPRARTSRGWPCWRPWRPSSSCAWRCGDRFSRAGLPRARSASRFMTRLCSQRSLNSRPSGRVIA